MLANIPKQL